MEFTESYAAAGRLDFFWGGWGRGERGRELDFYWGFFYLMYVVISYIPIPNLQQVFHFFFFFYLIYYKTIIPLPSPLSPPSQTPKSQLKTIKHKQFNSKPNDTFIFIKKSVTRYIHLMTQDDEKDESWKCGNGLKGNVGIKYRRTRGIRWNFFFYTEREIYIYIYIIIKNIISNLSLARERERFRRKKQKKRKQVSVEKKKKYNVLVCYILLHLVFGSNSSLLPLYNCRVQRSRKQTRVIRPHDTFHAIEIPEPELPHEDSGDGAELDVGKSLADAAVAAGAEREVWARSALGD